MSTEITEVEKPVSNPLEKVFDIEEGTTMVVKKEVSTELVVHEPYDEKDNELEEQFQEVYDTALEAFENQQDEAESMEPKFKARNAEVAAQYLNTALQAVREKRELKQHKDRMVADPRNKQGGDGPTNNIIVSRNDLLKMLQDRDEKSVNTLNAEDLADES